MSDNLGLASIIIPFHNLAHHTLACLASLAAATLYEPAELILVDNDSESGQTSMITGYLNAGYTIPWQIRIQPDNRGWVGGCIDGYEAMAQDTEWVVLLNNDTILSQGWLARARGALASRPDYGIMGCVSVGGGGWQRMDRLQEAGWVRPTFRPPDYPSQLENTAAQLQAVHGGEVHEVGAMVAFFAVALRRTMLQEIGFLDPKFGLGLGDDDDLCQRARANHWKIGVALDVPVWHWHRSTFNLLAAGGVDWKAGQQENMAYLQSKGTGVRMDRVLQYLGDRETSYPYIPHVPARDLDPRDMIGLEAQGWTEETLCRSGLYVPVEDLEIHPFCGAATDGGEPCRRLVTEWGIHCYQHTEGATRNTEATQ